MVDPNGPTRQNNLLCGLWSVGYVQMFENLVQAHIQRLVDHNTHGAGLIVLANIGQGPGKKSFTQCRHRHKEMIFE